MRKKWIAIVATMVLGVTIYGSYHAYGGYEQDKRIESDLLIANIEALAEIETNTTWKCQGSVPKNNCSAYCGTCGTRVPASGKSDGSLSGSHSCHMN